MLSNNYRRIAVGQLRSTIYQYGEMSDILSHISAEAFIYADFPWTESAWLTLLNQISAASISTIEARDGYSFTLDNLTFRVYFPPTAEFISTGDTDNANSLAIKISNQSGIDFLTCGDLESDGLALMISQHSSDINVELLKINHHGATECLPLFGSYCKLKARGGNFLLPPAS